METRCQKCRRLAEVINVSLHQNIGLVVVRLSESTSGNLCRKCIVDTVRTYNLVNITCGWFGVISFLMNPFVIGWNTIEYLRARRLTPPAAYGPPPAHPLAKYNAQIEQCINQGESRGVIAQALADMAGIPLRVATDYVTEVAEHLAYRAQNPQGQS